MKPIALSALLLLAPVAAAQVTRLNVAPRADIAARLTAIDPAAQLAAVSTAPDGTLRRLAGPLPLQGDDLTARAADFAARFAPLFGADASSVLGAPQPRQPRADGSPRAAFLPQLVHGWEVEGAGLTLLLAADGRATGAHGWVSAAAGQLAAPAWPADAAVTTALAWLGLQPGELHSGPSVHGVALVSPAPALAWRVQFIQKAGLTPWHVDVDAHTGAVLSARQAVLDAKGNIVLDGVTQLFNTGSGSGSAYKSVAKAIKAAEGGAKLPELTLEDIDATLQLFFGTLTGRYCTVSDFSAVLFSAFLSFPFADDSLESVGGVILFYEAFDHVNTYYWITKTAAHLRKITGTLPSDTCIPIIVNFDDDGAGFFNAFYSPDDLDEDGPFAPGFFLFGDFDILTKDVMDDFSRDPTAVSHEYFHGMCDFAGLSFGDDLVDTPPRAVNEAIADYASLSFHKTPLLGEAFMVHSGADLKLPGTSLRDLSEEITLPDNLFDTVNPETGLPEEHEAGKIFGCALWRLRDTAKQKPADDLIINHLAAWPQSSAEVGFPDVTPENAQAAYEAYDFECFLALINSALEGGTSKALKKAAKVLGAGLAHGILGAAPESTILLPTDTGKGTISWSSNFLGTLEQHAIAFALSQGQVLTIKLTGKKADGTQMDFTLDGDKGDLSFPSEKVFSADGTKVSQKNITVNETGFYTLTVSTGSGPGGYKAVVKIK